ncbi:DUF1007 family protein [Carnimonas nigrificans]|uniref:DUF1007 family protein n=1 Tax=Carnimonas nigrificans TaxID=64323 RepID=UPI00047250AC|nr:DUF1007 family protein [Carnimonas nigrificans]
MFESKSVILYRIFAGARLALLALSSVALLAGVCSPAIAHPHSWVDYRTEVHFNDSGEVIALREVWLMDPMYSMSLIEEMRNDGKEGQQRLAADVNRTLSKGHYLTHLFSGDTSGKELPIGKVKPPRVEQSGQRIIISFDVPLKKPLAVSAEHPFSYQVYDSTYYVEFLHDPDDIPIELVNAPQGCSAEVKSADPDPALVAKAAMIDQQGQAPDGLGRFFSDTGVVSCRGE